MGIPESKFSDWNGTGADKGSVAARNTIYNALRSERSPLEQKGDKYDVYLQGSYAEKTHTRGNSDVDVVAKLTSAWRRDLSELTPPEEQRYHDSVTEADYVYETFREDVHTALTTKFGPTAVTWDGKAIEISSDVTGSLSVDVDVVPCQEYRVYHSFPADSDPCFTSGMHFKPRMGGSMIINFPKRHIKNGREKSNRTSKKYKETVRMFKNARDYINKKRLLFDLDAPSYYITCLLYNLDDDLFKTTSRSDRFLNIVEALEDENVDNFCQQSEMQDLFGSDSTQWSTQCAEQFIVVMRDLWDDW